jgi:TPR repeat protein
MSKHLMYVVTLVLSVTMAACAAQYQSQRGTGGEAYAAEALQRGQAAYDRQDYLTAFRAWLPLAQQGYAMARYNLGLLYALGRGVARDDALAGRWFGQAAVQGQAEGANT